MDFKLELNLRGEEVKRILFGPMNDPLLEKSYDIEWEPSNLDKKCLFVPF